MNSREGEKERGSMGGRERREGVSSVLEVVSGCMVALSHWATPTLVITGFTEPPTTLN